MKINNEETIGIDIDKELSNPNEIKVNEDIEINLEDDNENINTTMPKAEQLEIVDDSTPTTTINIPQNEKSNLNQNTNNMNKELEERYNKYQQQHHHHYHGRHGIKNKLKMKIMSFFYFLDFTFTNTIDNISTSIDLAIAKIEFPSFVKRIIHTKQIMLWIYIINSNFLLSKVEKNDFLNQLFKYNLYTFIISVIILNIHFYLSQNNLFLKEDKQIENYAMSRNPNIKGNKCFVCNVIICMRAHHCDYCNKCVLKYHLHSHWFNLCIGSCNELIYTITLFVTCFYFLISFYISTYLIFFLNQNLHSYKIPIYTWTFISIYVIFKLIRFTYHFVFKILFNNLTYAETYNNRLTYLLKDYSRNFYNPFSKNCIKTLWEMIINTLNINIYKQSLNEDNNYIPINESSPTELIEENDNNIDFEQEIKAFKLILKLKEPFKTFISKDGHVHKKTNGFEINNWNLLRIYTVMDLSNSPFAEILYLNAEKSIQQYSQYAKQNQMIMQNQIQNQNQEEIPNQNENS